MFLSPSGFSQWEFVIHSELRPRSFHPKGVFFIYFSNQQSPTKQTKEGTTGCLPKGKGAGGREGRWERASVWWRQKGKSGEEERIRNVERMSVAGKTKEGRLCTVFCFAESAAEHGERRGQCVTRNNRVPPSLWAMQSSRLWFFFFFVFVTLANISYPLFYLLLSQNSIGMHRLYTAVQVNTHRRTHALTPGDLCCFQATAICNWNEFFLLVSSGRNLSLSFVCGCSAGFHTAPLFLSPTPQPLPPASADFW